MKSYKCNNCGAEIMINDENTFSRCIYCGSSVTLIKKEYGDLNIKKMLPFTTSEQEAVDYLTRVVGRARLKDIKDVKRVFIPVRFCSYDFTYLCSYDRVVSDGEDTSYIPTDGLIDGTVYKEAYLETNTMNMIYGFHDLRGKERDEFDPVRLGSISCEFQDNYKDDSIKEKMHAYVKKFGGSFFNGRDKTNITNVNHYINNVDIEPFTTLIPVYLVKTMGGVNYAVSGTINQTVTTNPTPTFDLNTTLAIALIFVGTCFFPLLFIGIPLLIFTANGNYNKNKKTKGNFEIEDNIKYKVYAEDRRVREFIHYNYK